MIACIDFLLNFICYIFYLDSDFFICIRLMLQTPAVKHNAVWTWIPCLTGLDPCWCLIHSKIATVHLISCLRAFRTVLYGNFAWNWKCKIIFPTNKARQCWLIYLSIVDHLGEQYKLHSFQVWCMELVVHLIKLVLITMSAPLMGRWLNL